MALNDTLSIDIARRGTIHIPAKQADHGYDIICTILRNGENIVDASTNTATFRVGKPDNTIYYGDATVNADNTVTIHVDDEGQMLAVPGFVVVDVTLNDGNGVVKSTQNFVLDVQAAPGGEAIPSWSVFVELEELVAEAREAIPAVPAAVEAANAAAENANASAENANAAAQHSVRYDTPQTLTTAQQKQARENIDALEPDGYYEGLTSGNAEQLLSSIAVSDKAPYLFRLAGGGNDIGNRETVKAITGGSVAWNQVLTKKSTSSSFAGDGWNYHGNGDGSWTIEVTAETASSSTSTNPTAIAANTMIVGHKYLWVGRKHGIRLDLKSMSRSTDTIFNCTTASYTNIAIVFADLPQGTYTIWPMLIDLTQMFDSTIADYVYSLEQANAGSGIAWLKSYGFFTEEYYPYNAGGMKHVSGLVSHDTVGFNAYDPDTGKAHVVGGQQYQVSGAYTALSLNGETITPDANGKYTPSVSGDLTVTGGNSTTTCVHLVHSGYRNGEYEPYVKHSYALDSTVTLRGRLELDSSNNLHYSGDRYLPDGTVERNWEEADLGELNWTTRYTGTVNKTLSTNLPVEYDRTIVLDGMAEKYEIVGSAVSAAGLNAPDDMTVGLYSYRQSSGTTTVLYAVLPINDVPSGKIVYKIAEPTTETAAPYSEIQICDDFGTEEYVVTPDSDGFQMPVGHETDYMQNLRDKLQRLPNLPDADGTYLVQYSNRQCSFVQYIAPTGLPTAPSGDGTYALKATVADGTVSYSWVAE